MEKPHYPNNNTTIHGGYPGAIPPPVGAAMYPLSRPGDDTMASHVHPIPIQQCGQSSPQQPPAPPSDIYLVSGAVEPPVDDSIKWCWLVGGVVLTFAIGPFALIPLCCLNDLKHNRVNRKYYLIGMVPSLILTIILYVVIIVLFISLGLFIGGVASSIQPR